MGKGGKRVLFVTVQNIMITKTKSLYSKHCPGSYEYFIWIPTSGCRVI